MFKVKTAYGQRFALKRVVVNNEPDLLLFRQEIAVTVSVWEASCRAKLETSVMSLLHSEPCPTAHTP